MNEFSTALHEQGVTNATVEPSSARGAGANDEALRTKWKTYYRSSCLGKWGVLLLPTSSDLTMEAALARLDEEACNFNRLQVAGYDVPELSGPVFEIVDHLNGPQKAAALIVEHIDGRGPYKATTESRSLMRYVNSISEPARSAAKDAWRALRRAAAECCPMDLQVIVSCGGRIVTIDPEKIGPGKKLITWQDDA